MSANLRDLWNAPYQPDIATRVKRDAGSTGCRPPSFIVSNAIQCRNIANIVSVESIPGILRTIRAKLDLTQVGLAECLGVSVATVNRWEGGGNKPQRAAMAKIATVAEEADVNTAGLPVVGGDGMAGKHPRRASAGAPTTKPMEQMLWDAACSIRGEKDASKFKDYLLPLLFLKRLFRRIR